MAGNLSRCHCLHGPSFCCNVGFLFCFSRSLSNRKCYDELCILHRPIHSPVCGWLRPPVVCEPDVYFYNSLMKNEIFVYVWSYNTYIFVIYSVPVPFLTYTFHTQICHSLLHQRSSNGTTANFVHSTQCPIYKEFHHLYS